MKYRYIDYWRNLGTKGTITGELESLEEWEDNPSEIECPFIHRHIRHHLSGKYGCEEFLCRKKWPELQVKGKYCPCLWLKGGREGITEKDIFKFVKAHIKSGYSYLKNLRKGE
jgi:hypothetical protein